MVALAKAASPGEASVPVPMIGCAVSDLARDADRLAAPRVVARLEGAGEKIQQADFRLGNDVRIETAEIDGKRCACQRSRQRHLA